MEQDLISIIIPVYNAEKFIEQTIQTIKNQTYQNWEAIFVDDGSQDNSKNLIKANLQENIKLIEFSQNYGPAIARNKGLEIAKGKYISYLDADDIWEKDKLEKQYSFMKENDYDFTYTSYKRISKKGRIGKSVKIQKELTYQKALKRMKISTITVMFNTERIDKQMLKMPNLEQAEDITTWLRILKIGHVAYGLQESLAFYRKSKNTQSSHKIKAMQKRWMVYRKLEKFSWMRSSYYFLYYMINAIERRI